MFECLVLMQMLLSSVVFSHYRHVQKEQPRHPATQVLHEAQDVTVGLTGMDAFPLPGSC